MLQGTHPNQIFLKLNEVNEAVNLSGGKYYEWRIRFLRGAFYMNLPDLFKKRDTAIDDFKFVKAEFNKNTNNQDIERVMGKVYSYLK